MTVRPRTAQKLPQVAQSTQLHLLGACCWWLLWHRRGSVQTRLHKGASCAGQRFFSVSICWIEGGMQEVT